MESSRRSLLLVVLACSSLLILAGPNLPRVQGQTLLQHPPILIASDSDFTAANGVNLTESGDGTPEKPFIIENWNITANTLVGIDVEGAVGTGSGVTKYFVIRNVLIHPASFTLGSSGILFDSISHGRVENVRVANFAYGISVLQGSQNIIANSVVWNNTRGIQVSGSAQTVTGNQFDNNTIDGLLVESSGNTFTGNDASSNGNLNDGAGFQISGSNNLFQNNTASGNTWFGFKTVGSISTASSNNVYRNNIVSSDGNLTGGGGIVFVENCTRNLIIGNTVTNNLNAIGLEASGVPDSYNILTLNKVIHNGFGIYLTDSFSFQNLVYNNYLNNTTNAFDNSLLNHWNTTEKVATNILGGPITGGNFYSDYQNADPDKDGIGDIPYNVSGAPIGQVGTQDLLPIVKGIIGPVANVAASAVAVQPSSLQDGGNFTITATALNRGTVSESFSVSLYRNGTLISGQEVNNLPPLSSIQLTFSWDTLGVQPGNNSLTAVASTVPGETYLVDNTSPPASVTVLLNLPPVASFTAPASTFASNEVTLDGSASQDSDGTVTRYTWDFGDGNTTITTARTISHMYPKAGSYTITLTVTDNNRATSVPVSETLTVESIRPSAPTNFQLSATSGKATLTWSPPSDTGGSSITGYNIYRGTSPTALALLATVGNVASYVDTTVVDDRTYYYQVTTVTQYGESLQSSQQDVLVPGHTSSTPNTNDDPFLWPAIAAVIVATAVMVVLVVRRKIHGRP